MFSSVLSLIWFACSMHMCRTVFMPEANAFADLAKRPFTCQSARSWTYCSLFLLVTATLSPPGTRGIELRWPKFSSSAENTKPRSSTFPSYLPFHEIWGCSKDSKLAPALIPAWRDIKWWSKCLARSLGCPSMLSKTLKSGLPHILQTHMGSIKISCMGFVRFPWSQIVLRLCCSEVDLKARQIGKGVKRTFSEPASCDANQDPSHASHQTAVSFLEGWTKKMSLSILRHNFMTQTDYESLLLK